MSFGLYVGPEFTSNGIGYLAGYGDEPSSHWLEIVPRQNHTPVETVTVGVTGEAETPGELSTIPQIVETYRHLRVSYSYYRGHPPPLTNGGLNEHGVAVRDIWSPSRAELKEMTSPNQKGPNYSDLARLVLERSRSAREGVELIGELIRKHGHSTYGGNSHMIADANEAWVVIEFAGNQGLWIAERSSCGSIRVSRPGHIGVVDANDVSGRNILFSDNFVSFAESMGWYSHKSSNGFDVNMIYGDGKGKWAGATWIEQQLLERHKRAGTLSITDLIWSLRNDMMTGDSAGYGQIVPLYKDIPAELRFAWHCAAAPHTSKFVPVFLCLNNIPHEYSQHRYLSFEEDRTYYDGTDTSRGQTPRVSQLIESSRSAVALSKRLSYLVALDHEARNAHVQDLWRKGEERICRDMKCFVNSARHLLAGGNRDDSIALLTYFSITELKRSLDETEALSRFFDAMQSALPQDNDDHGYQGPVQLW